MYSFLRIAAKFQAFFVFFVCYSHSTRAKKRRNRLKFRSDTKKRIHTDFRSIYFNLILVINNNILLFVIINLFIVVLWVTCDQSPSPPPPQQKKWEKLLPLFFDRGEG